jgi:hypothetical protein
VPLVTAAAEPDAYWGFLQFVSFAGVVLVKLWKSIDLDDNFQRNLYLLDFLFEEINVFFNSDI